MLTVGGLFDGVGLLAYGLHLAGLEHLWLCERDEDRRAILAMRWPGVPIFDDVRVVGAGTAEPVHVVAGGFPCKGVSSLGSRAGFGHPETVLWREMARAVGEIRPRYVLVENVADILALHDGELWAEVLGDLAALGFGVEWDVLPASAVCAPHGRPRVFAVATHPDRARADTDAAAGTSRAAVGERAGPAADADGMAGTPDLARGGRCEPMARPGALERAERLHGASETAADAEGERRIAAEPAQEQSRLVSHAGAGRGVGVEWGVYERAIRRWESIVGPAPEPLVRRMDDGAAARVERSRLSALGDGVQVQVGQLVGAYIVERERERLVA